jgi:hypothetical protein
MGHSAIGVTMNVYGHLFEGAQQRLTEQLDNLLTERRPAAADAQDRSGGSKLLPEEGD